MELDVVIQVYAVLTYSLYLWIKKSDVPVMLFVVVNLPVLAGYAVYTWCFHARAILDGPKETGDIPGWGGGAYIFYVMFG